jgi:hypothetical protein
MVVITPTKNDMMKTFIHIKWIDLSDSFQMFIINKMLICFNKNQNENNLINEIKMRFTKKSCMVDLYYSDKILNGICISWNTNQFIYLDKFFSIHSKSGTGTHMLQLFIETYTYIHTDSNDNILKNKLILWRTDVPTSLFYLKNNNVNKFFTHTIDNKSFVYLGVNKKIWEYEDIHDLQIKSCFTINIDGY